MLRGVYSNPDREARLCGKEALLREAHLPNYYLAQFDDVGTGLGHGWHPFPREDFERVREEGDAP